MIALKSTKAVNKYEDILACCIYFYKAIYKVMNKIAFLDRQARIKTEAGKKEEEGEKS